MRPYVVLLGPHLALCERAVRAGLGVIVVDTADRLDRDVLGLATEVLITDYTDVVRLSELLSVYARRLDIRGVLSLTEPGLLPAAKLNALLGYPDNPVEAVRRVVDKQLMRAHLEGTRFDVPAALVSGTAELRRFVAAHGLPVVVKPPDGSGSAGVRVLRSGAELAADLPFPLLAEAYLSGRELSVEAVSVAGRHTVVGVTEKSLFPGTQVEAGHRFPAALDRADLAGVTSFVADALTAMGIHSGLTHTEVMLASDGPMLVETHTRNGGDHIADLVHLATGFDMLDFALRQRAGGSTAGLSTPAAVRGAAIAYVAVPPGRVLEVSGTAAARYRPGVVDLHLPLRVGDQVRPLESSADRIGYAVATGADAAEAAARCGGVLDAVRVLTDSPAVPLVRRGRLDARAA